jgi:hypothetical protein
MSNSIIDLLAIEGNHEKRKKCEWLMENTENHKELLANTYMKLAEKIIKIYAVS